MNHKFTKQEKEIIVNAYTEGQPATSLCVQYGIPRSTLYSWVSQYRKLNSTNQTSVSYREYYDLKRYVNKLEERLKVIKAAGCGTSAPLKEKLAALEKLYGQYSVHALCDALDVSRGTFYNHIFRKKDVTVYEKRREEVGSHIKEIFEKSQQRFGANKVCAVLAEQGVKATPKYVAEIMREMGLYSISIAAKREHKKNMTSAKKQNILQRQFSADAPNLVWVSDVTCFKVNDKYFYICVIIDLFSRKVIAYKVSTNNTTYLITSTFKIAFENRARPKNLTFHSDRGAQYTSNAFQKLLRLNKVVQSFSATGNPHDNAVAEAFFASLKREELYRRNYKSEREFLESVDNYVIFFNANRPHRTLAYKTPERFEQIYSGINSEE